MRVGIVGFPGAGKTTVFNALTGLGATVGGYSDPAKPNLGTIKVPDDRIDRLAAIFKPKKITYAEIVFADFPAPAGERALDPASIAQMRDVDALVQVVRGFVDPTSDTAPEVVKDLRGFQSELILADYAVIEKRLERIRKEKGKQQEQALLERLLAALEAEIPLRKVELSDADARSLAGFGLLSRLPIMALINQPDSEAGQPIAADIVAGGTQLDVALMGLCAQIEMEIATLAPEDRLAFLADLGLTEPARGRFVRAAYGLLDLISFLTSGEDEVRAWPIRRGTTAVRAAGKIHSDIERGFIRAEVVAFEDFIAFGSDAKCREAGKLRLEGKEYVVHDGDIMHFRFNV